MCFLLSLNERLNREEQQEEVDAETRRIRSGRAVPCVLGGLKFSGSSGVNFLLLILSRLQRCSGCSGWAVSHSRGWPWVPEPGHAQGGDTGVCHQPCQGLSPALSRWGLWQQRPGTGTEREVLSKDRESLTALLPLKLTRSGDSS